MKPPYKITNKILRYVIDISQQIGEIKSAYLEHPPLQLRKENRIKTIKSSLEIEGNTLSIEQITALFENRRVIGPKEDILEVQNAIRVYARLPQFKSTSMKAFLQAHKILMEGLIADPGEFRTQSVGILHGSQLAHLAPPGSQVLPLMKHLFDYLKKDDTVLLIKSCVFHYEVEFIHPFLDGNGRMGRLWQTKILMEEYPVFEYVPLESIIQQRQEKYYTALSNSDKAGRSTIFIEFMLEVIRDALNILLQSQNISISPMGRLELLKRKFEGISFTRKDYLRQFKDISTATASRDLKLGVEKGLLERIGDKRMAKYRIKG